jgi:hypothetical protein
MSNKHTRDVDYNSFLHFIVPHLKVHDIENLFRSHKKLRSMVKMITQDIYVNDEKILQVKRDR